MNVGWCTGCIIHSNRRRCAVSVRPSCWCNDMAYVTMRRSEATRGGQLCCRWVTRPRVVGVERGASGIQSASVDGALPMHMLCCASQSHASDIIVPRSRVGHTGPRSLRRRGLPCVLCRATPSSRSSYVQRRRHPRAVSVRTVLSYDVAYGTMRQGGLGHREVPLLSVGYFAPRLKGAISPHGDTRRALGTAQGPRITAPMTVSQSRRLERSRCGDVHPTLDLSRPRVPSVSYASRTVIASSTYSSCSCLFSVVRDA